MEANEKTFEPKVIIENDFFKDEIIKTFDSLVEKNKNSQNKALQKDPSVSFKRNWKDSFDENEIDRNNIILCIKDIIYKKSKYPSKVRNSIRAIYSLSIDSFMERMLKAGTENVSKD